MHLKITTLFYFNKNGSIIFVGVFKQFHNKKKHKITLFYILELSRNKQQKGDLCCMNFNMNIPGLKGVDITKFKMV